MNEHDRNQINNLSKINDFDGLQRLFIENDLGFHCYRYFLTIRINKKTGILGLSRSFWFSDFSGLFLKEILESTFCHPFTMSLFSSDENCSPSVIYAYLEINESLFIDYFKRCRGYNLPKFVEYLNNHNSERIKKLLQEFIVIKRHFELNKENLRRNHEMLLSFPFYNVLHAFCNYRHPDDDSVFTKDLGVTVSLIDLL